MEIPAILVFESICTANTYKGRYPGGKELPDPLFVQNRGGLQDRIMHYTYPIDDLIHLTKVDKLWDTVRYVF
jgi:hypothetical protein